MPEENGDSFVRITNREIYDAIRSLEKKVDQHESDRKKDRESIDSNTKKIRSLEMRTYALLAGVVSALTLLVGSAIVK